MQQEQSATTGDDGEAKLPWRRFPTGHARIVANRWLDRRRALLFVGWFGLVLLPVLALISWGARVGGVAGLLIIVVAVVFAFCGTVFAMATVGGWRAVINHASAVDEHSLLTRWGWQSPIHQDLHAGVIRVLEPGWRRGRAHILAVEYPPPWPIIPKRAETWLLLSNPATGEIRDARDLRQLADVLCASPMEGDRVAGRMVLALSSQATLAAGEPTAVRWDPEDEPPLTVWSALKSFGRTLALLLTIVVIFLVGGSIEAWRQTGADDAVANAAVYLVILSAVALGSIWLIRFLTGSSRPWSC